MNFYKIFTWIMSMLSLATNTYLEEIHIEDNYITPTYSDMILSNPTIQYSNYVMNNKTKEIPLNNTRDLYSLNLDLNETLTLSNITKNTTPSPINTNGMECTISYPYNNVHIKDEYTGESMIICIRDSPKTVLVYLAIEANEINTLVIPDRFKFKHNLIDLNNEETGINREYNYILSEIYNRLYIILDRICINTLKYKDSILSRNVCNAIELSVLPQVFTYLIQQTNLDRYKNIQIDIPTQIPYDNDIELGELYTRHQDILKRSNQHTVKYIFYNNKLKEEMKDKKIKENTVQKK
ncbi:hypothetical protein NEOKW01_1126 [Nematocida sp. AWRm80]|nr:hypothetical protein NEOKW01_1126 [Nematocida sp. AWRm80]